MNANEARQRALVAQQKIAEKLIIEISKEISRQSLEGARSLCYDIPKWCKFESVSEHFEKLGFTISPYRTFSRSGQEQISISW
jgi:hypothetical protein